MTEVEKMRSSQLADMSAPELHLETLLLYSQVF